MKWIETGGGPFILVPEHLVLAWTGGDGNDYEQACSISDYLGLIPLKEESALVLGDEPMMTAFHSLEDTKHEEFYLVRWICAPSKSEMERNVRCISQVEFGPPMVEMNIASDALFLFDSAYPGSHLPEDVLRIELVSGWYRIDTAHYSQGFDLEFLAHRFGRMEA